MGYDLPRCLDLKYEYRKAELRGNKGLLRENRLIGWNLVYSVGTRITLGSDRTLSLVVSGGRFRRLPARIFRTFSSTASLGFWSARIHNIVTGGSDATGVRVGTRYRQELDQLF